MILKKKTEKQATNLTHYACVMLDAYILTIYILILSLYSDILPCFLEDLRFRLLTLFY